MRRGSIGFHELEGILSRNAYRPWHIVYTNRRKGDALPPDVVTIRMMNNPQEIQDYDELWNWYNVAKFSVPEMAVRKNGKNQTNGWRPILYSMLKMREIRPSREIRTLLGESEFDLATQKLGCY